MPSMINHRLSWTASELSSKPSLPDSNPLCSHHPSRRAATKSALQPKPTPSTGRVWCKPRTSSQLGTSRPSSAALVATRSLRPLACVCVCVCVCVSTRSLRPLAYRHTKHSGIRCPMRGCVDCGCTPVVSMSAHCLRVRAHSSSTLPGTRGLGCISYYFEATFHGLRLRFMVSGLGFVAHGLVCSSYPLRPATGARPGDSQRP